MKAHQFFLYAEIEVTVLIAFLLIKVDSFRIGMIFDLSYHRSPPTFKLDGNQRNAL